MGAATKNLPEDGSSDWFSHLYQFNLCADSLLLNGDERGAFLKSALAGPALKLVVNRFQKTEGLVIRIYVTSSAVCSMGPRWPGYRLDSAYQKSGESLHQWEDRLRDIRVRVVRVKGVPRVCGTQVGHASLLSRSGSGGGKKGHRNRVTSGFTRSG